MSLDILHQLLAGLPSAAVLCDGDGCVLAANRAARALLADSEGQPLLADSEGQPLLADSEGQPLLADSEGQPLLADSEGLAGMPDRWPADGWVRLERRGAGAALEGRGTALTVDGRALCLVHLQLARVQPAPLQPAPLAPAEAEAEALERALAQLSASLPEVLWTSTPDGQLRWLTSSFEEHGQAAPQSDPGCVWSRYFHPDDLPSLHSRWTHCLEDGQPLAAEVRLCRRPELAWRWHLLRGVPLRDSRGQILRWIGTATDIEEQRQSEAAFRLFANAAAVLAGPMDVERRLRGLAEVLVPNLADACVLRVQRWGEQRPEHLVVSHTVPEQARLLEQLASRIRPTAAMGLGPMRVLVSGEPQLVEEVGPELLRRMPARCGVTQLLEVMGVRSFLIVPLVSHGRLFGTMSLLTTRWTTRRLGREQVRLAQELAERVAGSLENARLFREAEDAVRLRDEFLAVASHELKTPLTPLNLQLQILQRQLSQSGPLDRKRAAAALDLALRQVRRLANLARDLLDGRREATQSSSAELSREDLRAVVQEVVDGLCETFARSGTPLELRPGPPLVGVWDRARVEQILSNLLSNALKFGGQRPVMVELRSLSGGAELEVTDHGIGIAPEDQARIFGRFERAVSTKHFGGLGLGLWIVQCAVEAMQGSIRVESEPGARTTFTVRLPSRGAAAGVDRDLAGMRVAGQA